MQQTRQRINQLTNLDNQADSQNAQYYAQALTEIRDHLYQFYSQYADANGLTISQVSRRVNQWDLAQWKQAIRSMNISSWPQGAVDTLKSFSGEAGGNKRHMLGALVKLSILGMAVRQYMAVRKRVKQDGQNQLHYVTKEYQLTYGEQHKASSVITQAATHEMWSDNLWVDTEDLGNDIEKLVNQHLKHGLSLQDLQDMLIRHSNPKQFKPNESLADRLVEQETNAKRIIRTESARLIDQVNMTTFKMKGVRYVNWVTEPGACEKCQGIADGGPYSIYDCPSIPDDSHPNCRCSKIPVEDKFKKLAILQPGSLAAAPKMTDTDKGAINRYISSDAYTLNDALRRGTPLSPQQQLLETQLDAALKKVPYYQGNIQRTLSTQMLPTSVTEFLNNYSANKAITFKAYSSFATNTYDPNADNIMKIRNSRLGKDIRSFNPKEKEILYPRNSKFIVVNKSLTNDGKTVIELKEAPHGFRK